MRGVGSSSPADDESAAYAETYEKPDTPAARLGRVEEMESGRRAAARARVFSSTRAANDRLTLPAPTPSILGVLGSAEGRRTRGFDDMGKGSWSWEVEGTKCRVFGLTALRTALTSSSDPASSSSSRLPRTCICWVSCGASVSARSAELALEYTLVSDASDAILTSGVRGAKSSVSTSGLVTRREPVLHGTNGIISVSSSSCMTESGAGDFGIMSAVFDVESSWDSAIE